MRTQRAAAAPSNRVPSRFEKGFHYVKAQKMGGDYHEDNITPLLDEFDPKTGKPAYEIAFDGETEADRRVTQRRNVAILRCSQDYIDRVNKANSAESVRKKDMQPNAPLGTPNEDFGVDAVQEMPEVTPQQMVAQAAALEGSRVRVTPEERALIEASGLV